MWGVSDFTQKEVLNVVYAYKPLHYMPPHSGAVSNDVLRFYRMESDNDKPLVLLDTATLAELYFLLYLENRGEAALLFKLSERDKALAYCCSKGLI